MIVLSFKMWFYSDSDDDLPPRKRSRFQIRKEYDEDENILRESYRLMPRLFNILLSLLREELLQIRVSLVEKPPDTKFQPIWRTF